MRKPSMRSLLTEWRKLVNEHVTNEEHEHPHDDENDDALNELDFSGPATQSDADVYGTPEQAAIEDALISCFCDWAQGGRDRAPFNQFKMEVAKKLGVSPESLAQACEKINTGAM